MVGTSLVRGVSGHLAEKGISATVYAYPGHELSYIRKRISIIFTPRYQPQHVVVQCGGNDATRPPHRVVREYDRLVTEVRRACPETTITLNLIPPRGSNDTILENIAKINTYISNRGKRGDRLVSCDPRPRDSAHFKRDLTHFNETGIHIFASRLAAHIPNLRVCLQN